MIQKITALFFTLLLLSASVFAAETHEDELAEGEALVEAQVDCADLTDEQLEAIGDYIMELMHPGDAHDAMHLMMGLEEGTEEHERFHIALAERMYCGSSGYGYGMGMMYGGMMSKGYSMMGSGMMGSTAYSCMNGYCSYQASWSIVSLLYLLLLVGIVVLIVLLIIKLWRSLYGAKKKR